jgi:hypothetical protein
MCDFITLTDVMEGAAQVPRLLPKRRQLDAIDAHRVGRCAGVESAPVQTAEASPVDMLESRTIEPRAFDGMSLEETAEVLHLYADTVNKDDRRLAKLWWPYEFGDAR